MRATPIVVFCFALALAATAAPVAPTPAPGKEKLVNPAMLTEKAPDAFRVKFETSKGDFVVEVTRSWAPNGADRFYNLVKNGYYDGVRFFRVVPNFVVQFGIQGRPAVNDVWRGATFPDDPVTESNKRGTITYATSGKNARTTQVFINLKDNGPLLDGRPDNFAPFGKVVEGLNVVDQLYPGYGDGPPSGRGPEQSRLQKEGNTYLDASFPKLDYIKKAYPQKGEAKKAAAPKPAEKKPEARP
jgi:peptidyl-prolyl cis-trans isomerase A (cyclophilin A)